VVRETALAIGTSLFPFHSCAGGSVQRREKAGHKIPKLGSQFLQELIPEEDTVAGER
jgi:hypothetical protein